MDPFQFEFFGEKIAFDKTSALHREVTSDDSGLKYSATTAAGEHILSISVGGIKPGPAPEPKEKEGVLTIPLEEEPVVIYDKTTNACFISIGGPRPKSSDGPTIRLDAAEGNWHTEHDPAANVLHVAFSIPGPKPKPIPK